MKNHPLTSIKVSDNTFEKLQKAVELSGKDTADVRRLCLDLGLAAFERMEYDIERYAADRLAESEPTFIPPLKSLPANKKAKSSLFGHA